MRSARLWIEKLVVIFALALPGLVSASEPIDILVALVPGAFNGSGQGDAAFLAQVYENDIAVAMQRSEMSDKQFRFRPYLLVAGLPNGDPAKSGDALNFVMDDVDLLLTTARNTAEYTLPQAVSSYDLVILVVESLVKQSDPSDFICGSARHIYYQTTGTIPVTSASETRFAAVVSESAGCRQNRSRTVLHEIGHIFGGDHQAPINGQEVDVVHHSDDDDLSKPIGYPNNHPVVHIGSDEKPVASSVMGGSGYMFPVSQFSSSTPGHTLVGSQYSAGGPGADMKAMIEQWWDFVAAYRPIPPPPPPCEVIHFGCSTAQIPREMLFVSFDEPLGYSATGFVAQRRLTNGTWADVGGLSNPGCVVDIPNLSGSILYRVIMNTIHGSSQCHVTYLADPTLCQEDP